MTLRGDSQRDTRKASSGTNIKIITGCLSEILVYRKRVLKVQNNSILKRGNASKVQNFVLLDNEIEIIKEHIFCRQVKIKTQATKGRI